MGQHYVDELYIAGPVFQFEVGETNVQLVLDEGGTMYQFEGLDRPNFPGNVHKFQDGTVGITMSRRCTCRVSMDGGAHPVYTKEGVFADQVYVLVDKETEILVDEEGVAVVAPKGAAWPDKQIEIEGDIRVFTHPSFPCNVVAGRFRPTPPVEIRKRTGRPVMAQPVG